MNGRVGRMDNIAALDQRSFERELQLNELGWEYHGQRFIPDGAFGGGMLRIASMGEIYLRQHPVTEPDEYLEFWWVSPDNIGKVVRDGKEYPNPSEQVIRMLVQ